MRFVQLQNLLPRDRLAITCSDMPCRLLPQVVLSFARKQGSRSSPAYNVRPTVELTRLILHAQDRVCDAVGPLFGLIRRNIHASVDWLTLKKTTRKTALHDILSISNMATFVPDSCGIIVPADLRVDRDVRVSSQVSIRVVPIVEVVFPSSPSWKGS